MIVSTTWELPFRRHSMGEGYSPGNLVSLEMDNEKPFGVDVLYFIFVSVIFPFFSLPYLGSCSSCVFEKPRLKSSKSALNHQLI